MFPKEEKTVQYTVGTCLAEWKDNNTLIKMCESEVRPCTSGESGLVYKNQYCAKCNADDNCVDWSLDVDCAYDEFTNENFKSYAEIKAALDKHECKIQYKPTIDTDFSMGVCHVRDYLNKVQIDRCNVTGLWRQYDADIDWACNNFIIPYKVFKNIFCYICNPSHGNVRTESLIDNCHASENNTNLFNISSACKVFPVSDRLQPFKNIYCYVCSQGQNLLKSSPTNVSALGDISEINDRASLKTNVYVSLVFPYENKVYEAERFVRESMNGALKYVNKNPTVEEKNSYNVSNIDDIINMFVTVCGNGPLCSNDKKDNESFFYGNPVCRHCSCQHSCAENEMCCLDTTLLKQPYTCLNAKTFPILQKHNADGLGIYYETEQENISFKLIDKCLNESHELSVKCSSSANAIDFIADVPIGSYGKISYRNIYCYKCNNEMMKPIVLDFQAYCRTFIEYDLFTNLTLFLNTLMSQCQTISFLPLKSKTCVQRYDDLKASYIGGEHFQRVEQHPSTFDKVVTKWENVLAGDINDSVKDVFSSCNITGYLKESSFVAKSVCESNSLTILSLPEYRFDNKVYKNFACFLCNPEFNALNISSESVISDCRVNSSEVWYIENTILTELCQKTPQNDRWFPFKNMYCAECNSPPWQLVSILFFYKLYN